MVSNFLLRTATAVFTLLISIQSSVAVSSFDRDKTHTQISINGKVGKWVSPWNEVDYRGSKFQQIFTETFKDIALEFEKITGLKFSSHNNDDPINSVGIVVIPYNNYKDFVDNTQKYFGPYYNKYGFIVDGRENSVEYANCSAYQVSQSKNSYAAMAGIIVVNENLGEDYFRECLFSSFHYFMGIVYSDHFERLAGINTLQKIPKSSLTFIEKEVLKVIYLDNSKPGDTVTQILNRLDVRLKK